MKIVLSANSHWNIYNFRLNFVKKLLIDNEIYILGKKDQSTRYLKKIGCKTIDLNIDPHGKSFIKEIILFVKYFNLIKNIKPDIYLGFTIKPNIYGSIASRLLKIKSICNITGLGEVFIKGGYLKKLIVYLYKFSVKKSDYIFLQNKSDLNYFKSIKLITNNRCKLIPGSGINLENYPSYKKKKNKKNFKFLFVGRIIREKGIFELIDAFKKISYKKKKVLLILVGKKNKNLNLKIRNSSSIKYVSFKKNIIKYYKNSDCFIMPSYREGLSRSILEAASLSLPILASNVPGCKELVKNNKNGYLFNINSQKSIIFAIEKILNLDNKKLLAMGKRSRLIASKNYSDKKVIKIYFDTIKKLKNEKKV